MKEAKSDLKLIAVGEDRKIHSINPLSNIEASYIAMERMKAMSVEETLKRMSECRGSDTATAIESLLGFSKDN